jgi:hypothetical protein
MKNQVKNLLGEQLKEKQKLLLDGNLLEKYLEHRI